MTSAWLLCILLDRNAPDPVRVCMRLESRAACELALADWLKRGYGWADRSRLRDRSDNPPVFAGCKVIDDGGGR